MADFGRCADSSCKDTAVRLFHCAHHCTKMVCLHHLTEHDRLVEHDRQEIEKTQSELRRFAAIYSSLIDEEKLRTDYEQKLYDYKRLVFDVNDFFEHHFNEIDQVRSMMDRVKKSIQERQKQLGESLTIVKVEASEEMNTSTASLPPENSKDELLCISFDRIQNIVIDTDYHRRKTMEINTRRVKSEKPMVHTDSKEMSPLDTPMNIRQIAGPCPLWIDGAYGITEKDHLVRSCSKKRYIDLNEHLRRYHGLISPAANVIARAVHFQIPSTRILFPATVEILHPQRVFFCPMHKQCQQHTGLPRTILRQHFIEAHHLDDVAASVKTNQVMSASRTKSASKVHDQVLQVIADLGLSPHLFQSRMR